MMLTPTMPICCHATLLLRCRHYDAPLTPFIILPPRAAIMLALRRRDAIALMLCDTAQQRFEAERFITAAASADIC